QLSQVKEIVIPEVIPEIKESDSTIVVESSSIVAEGDSTIIEKDLSVAVNKTDSTTINKDQLVADLDSTTLDPNANINTDSVVAKPKDILEVPVQYSAQDSIIFTADNMGFLYGKAEVNYGELGIKGEYITMDMDSSLISSTFGIDSLGVEFGFPIFTESGSEYEMKGVKYNFKTRKAFIHNVVTQQGEGNIVAKEAKKNADN